MPSKKQSGDAEVAAQLKKLVIPNRKDERADLVRLDELRRLFGKLVQNGEFVVHHDIDNKQPKKKTSSSALDRWNAFLQKSFATMIQQLTNAIEKGHRPAVRTLWGVLAACPNQDNIVSTVILSKWIQAVSKVDVNDKSLRNMIVGEFWSPHADSQYYSLIGIAWCANDLYKKQSKEERASSASSEESSSEDGENSDEEADDDTRHEQAERLVQLLLLFPMVQSQQELDEKGHLFEPPPPPSRLAEDSNKQKEEERARSSDDDEDDSSSSSSDDDDSDADDDAFDSSSEEEEQAPALKKQKVEKKKSSFAKSKRKRKNIGCKFQSYKAHVKAWGQAWRAVLKLPLSPSLLKQVLLFVPRSVLPVVSNPLAFADFFMTAYDDQAGGVIAVLALEGLFWLLTTAGLEYENFYKQLYALVTPSVLHCKYKNRFLQLLAKCLSNNPMLPAHVVAAFCKRLLRCSLYAPPSSILYSLALVSNLLKKHPETTCLVHREGDDSMQDGFDEHTDDPEQANALASCLWELQALERHYIPAVVTLAQSVGSLAEVKAPLYDVDDFLSQTYPNLMEQERKRLKHNNGKDKSKRPKRSGGKGPAAALTFVKPSGLFSSSDLFANVLQTR